MADDPVVTQEAIDTWVSPRHRRSSPQRRCLHDTRGNPLRDDYGFLDVVGGPLGKLAPAYPRDCDAVLTFADLLTREVDARWQR